MKRLLLLYLLLFAFTAFSFAQDGGRIFRKFKGEVSVHYQNFPGSDIKNGFGVTLEPHWAVLDKLSLGIRSQSGGQYKHYSTVDRNGYPATNTRTKIYESLGVTADYYFTNDYNARPFIGCGGGLTLVDISNTDVGYDTNNGDGSSTKFTGGVFARAGIEIRHFRIALEYNFIGNTKSPYSNYDYTTYSYKTVYDVSKNSYIAFKLGFCFSGGPYKK